MSKRSVVYGYTGPPNKKSKAELVGCEGFLVLKSSMSLTFKRSP